MQTEAEQTQTQQVAADEGDIHAQDDHELLTFQKQRSTPKIRLSSIGDSELILLDVDTIAQAD